jgi:molybdopterin-guanine dinucleotide biosynthesis protein A
VCYTDVYRTKHNVWDGLFCLRVWIRIFNPREKGGGLVYHENVTVQIMLGGQSTRMGRDKALVELDGETLLVRALAKWRDFGPLQLSVGGAERTALAWSGVPAVVDVYPRRGPLGGLHAGLAVCRTELLLLVAVDSPFVTQTLAEGLLNSLGGADACVYTLNGRPQPLFGLYRTRCLPTAQALLAAGENKMRLLLEQVDTVYLPADDPAPFRNLNTPEELAAAQSTQPAPRPDHEI